MTEHIPLAGVLGCPIGHSRSPRLHARWLERYGLAGHYVPMNVDAADLRSVIEVMPKMGFVGCNVTLPHKERVLELADEVSDLATRIGAANTLLFDRGRLLADNTDAYGFTENLRQTASDWSPEVGPAAIIGAGGASRAVIVALLDAGVTEIRIANRTRARAEALRDAFGHDLHVVDWDRPDELLEGALTVVNASSLGMTGQPPLDVGLDALDPSAVVTDLVYEPLETEFLGRARRAGATTVDGLGMLLHQAVPGFETWFGLRPVVDAATRDAVMAA